MRSNYKVELVKENRNINMNSTSADRQSNLMGTTSQNSRVAAGNKSYIGKNHEGLSTSSFSSLSNRGMQGGAQGTTSRVQSMNNQQLNTESIAQQLSKSYFLNTKQLLRHLSPARNSAHNEHHQSISHGPENGANSNLSQRQAPNRGRNRSTANASMSFCAGKAKPRKTHSHSYTRSQNQQQLHAHKNRAAVSGNLMSAKAQTKAQHSGQRAQLNSNASHGDEDRATKSKSATLGAHPGNLAPKEMSGGGQPVRKNKQNVDKLIKQNIRKNKSKMEDDMIKKQLEEYRQMQRKAELSQRNQEVRKINASKVVTHTEERGQSQAQQSSGQIKRRSQSCIENSNKKSGTGQQTSERRKHNSQGRQQNAQQVQPQAVSQVPQPTKIKPVPLTTTNVGSKQAKPRSFVDEINQLTHMVEKELGREPRQFQRHTNKLNSSCLQKSKQAARVAAKLNETAPDSNYHDKTALSAQLLGAANMSGFQSKKSKKAPSQKLQKFIERKKREEMVKKSMEQTIEVDKQLKIQQNLSNLNKFVKRHLKNSSVSAKPAKAPPKKHRKNKTNFDGVQNLADINFGIIDKRHPEQQQEISAILGSDPLIEFHNTQLLDSYRQHQGASQASSLLAESQFNPEIQPSAVVRTAGTSNRQGS